MKIIAGLGYDDRLPNHPPELLDCLLCGEQGLIAALEFRAGTVSPEDSQAARTVAYLNALKDADDGNRFYSQSLIVDPMASAESLLVWRDWAVLHGWSHDPGSRNYGRMEDLAAAEAHFAKKGTSLGERIYALLPRLNLVTSSISEIELHHDRACWPPLFQCLFEELEEAGLEVHETPTAITPQASDNSDLGKFQRALIGEHKGSLDLQQDGTLRLFSAASDELAAQFAICEANNETLIIAPNGHHCLATAAKQLGGNQPGIGDPSSFRAPNQLLLLMLQCAWQTPSAEALLQYLSLPAGRFQRLRRVLARRFRDLPGFDRAHWDEEISRFITDTLKNESDQDETSLRTAIDEWLPICVCPSDDVMPVALAVSLTDRVANYWRALGSTTDQEQPKTVFASAHAAADAVGQALREWPESDISKIQLNRLITMVLRIGNCSLRDIREVSAFDLISSAEVVPLRTTPFSHAFWINPKVSAFTEAPPLSKEELSGIPLAPDPAQQAQFTQQALERAHVPLLAAQKSLTLISTEQAPELLKLQLSSLMGPESWLPLEDSILGKEDVRASMQQVKDFNLLQPQRWWSLGCTVPVPRSKESFSSLAALALRPHEYALKYAAQIHDGAIESLAADARLKGNLAHHLVEAWINEHPWNCKPVDRSSISSWLERNLPVTIRKVALPLAQPGMQVERLKFQQQMLDAMDKLLEALVEANAIRVETERRFEFDDNLAQLVGTMDIFCQFEDGRFAIIDMKWGGYEKYREELRSGRPLQLATYAHIAEGARAGQLADAGYFILSRAELLCNHKLVFRTAKAIEPEEPTSMKLTWQKFESTLRWRMDQLKSGRVELTYGSEGPDNDSTPPDNGLDLLSIEDMSRKNGSSYYKAAFKTVDIWRNLTGNIKEH